MTELAIGFILGAVFSGVLVLITAWNISRIPPDK